MCELSTDEVRELILELLGDMREPYTWVTGEVELHLRTGERIPGELKSVDDGAVVLATTCGERRVPLAEVINVIVRMASPGPE